MEYIVSERNNERLDVYLSNILEGKTRSYIKNLIDEEKILVNDKKVKAGYVVKPNDKIYVEEVQDKLSEITPENIDINIVYEDDDFIIVDKQKGMVVHPANGNYSGIIRINSYLNNLKCILINVNMLHL